MGRLSSIKRLPAEVKAHIDKLIRWDKFTLDEIVEAIRAEYPDLKEVPSRITLWRYQQATKKMIEEVRNIQLMSESIVSEVGENFDDKTIGLLTALTTNMTTNAVMGKLGKDEVATKEVLELAKATNQAIAAHSKSLETRQKIEKAAQEKLIAKQKAKLDELGKSGEVSQEVLNKVIKAAYGIEI